ncbi:acyl-CoA dehydrogenase family protein [Novosphingobium cyanobacteriorum]|uniref:Acyl-CoA dehydrogenase family protein n=1 Tax=Novosphingobium cyanobacteriorum TaxID=3024215 RepID=A0ABT6CL21_9SPHN|nr:acyl-CoA dehydrogenase family protein [Novosphingobium cyanobacteriorum]MDF8334601.1 acyl-CoA dehydrogenase family protein [Novosphingobium cyanobacteriorum]
MDFELSEMQQMVVDSAERLVTAETGLDQWHARRKLTDGVDPKLWVKMAELGWMALVIPEDAGGLGCPMEDLALLMIELGRGLVTEPLISTSVLAAHVLDRALVSERRAHWLGRIATGEVRIALAHEEPHTNGTIGVSARRIEDGYMLDGQKAVAFDAPSAGYLLVTSELEGTSALFLVARESTGIATNSYALIDGSRAADLTFASAHVPSDGLIASGAAADRILNEALDRARVALIAQAVGAMEVALRITAGYAKERQQFGQPIGKFQAVQHMAADMFVAAYQARSALYAALRDIDGDASKRARSVAMAKVVAGMAGQTVSRNGVQIHGGYGVTDEYVISHYYRRLLVLEKQYGGIDLNAAKLALCEAEA